MSTVSELRMVTTPHLPGYRVRRVLGVASGLTARTRGVGGKFVAGLQSLAGGEVSAFTLEMEKARVEALQRLKDNAARLGLTRSLGLMSKQRNIPRNSAPFSNWYRGDYGTGIGQVVPSTTPVRVVRLDPPRSVNRTTVF